MFQKLYCLLIVILINSKHLGQKASIVHCADFETGAIKVMKRHGKLSAAEKVALQTFEIIGTTSIIAAAASTDVLSSGEENNAERRVGLAQEASQSKSVYRSMAHLYPTSVICERLLSDAKRIMTVDRRQMDPSTQEMFLILKF